MATDSREILELKPQFFKNHIYYLIYDLNKKLKRLLSCFGFTESTVSLIFSNTPSKHTVEKILLKKL